MCTCFCLLYHGYFRYFFSLVCSILYLIYYFSLVDSLVFLSVTFVFSVIESIYSLIFVILVCGLSYFSVSFCSYSIDLLLFKFVVIYSILFPSNAGSVTKYEVVKLYNSSLWLKTSSLYSKSFKIWQQLHTMILDILSFLMLLRKWFQKFLKYSCLPKKSSYNSH